MRFFVILLVAGQLAAGIALLICLLDLLKKHAKLKDDYECLLRNNRMNQKYADVQTERLLKAKADLDAVHRELEKLQKELLERGLSAKE